MPASTPTLRDMVQDALDRGQTLEQLETRAVDPQTGKRASKSLLSRIKRNDVDRIPNDYHLRGIAVALNVPYAAVRRAAISQWLPAEDSETDPRTLLEVANEAMVAAKRLTEIAERQAAEGQTSGERETA